VKHAFWLILTIAVFIWYSLVVVFVAVRGASDLRKMLRSIGRGD